MTLLCFRILFLLVTIKYFLSDCLSYAVTVCVQLKQLEMQLEQEYEEKQMVIHEKHDLEGLIATLCDQVCKHTLIHTHTYCIKNECLIIFFTRV